MLLIRAWRKKRGKSMAWLAETLGVSVKTVSKWERGDRQPHTTMIPAIAAALAITPGALFPKPTTEHGSANGTPRAAVHALAPRRRGSRAPH